jgi:hypothetical protein
MTSIAATDSMFVNIIVFPMPAAKRHSLAYVAEKHHLGEKCYLLGENMFRWAEIWLFNCFRAAQPTARHIRYVHLSGPLRGSCAEMPVFLLKIIAFRLPN